MSNDLISRTQTLNIIRVRYNSSREGTLENQRLYSILTSVEELPTAYDLEEAVEYICDHLCRFRHNQKFTQEELEGICDECNLGAVLGITEETKDTTCADPVSDHNDPWKRQIMERFTEVN